MSLFGQCGYAWRSFTFHSEEVISQGHKKLYIRFTPVEYVDVDWKDAKCNIEEGKVLFTYGDDRVEIPFDPQYDYAQAHSHIDGEC